MKKSNLGNKRINVCLIYNFLPAPERIGGFRKVCNSKPYVILKSTDSLQGQESFSPSAHTYTQPDPPGCHRCDHPVLRTRSGVGTVGIVFPSVRTSRTPGLGLHLPCGEPWGSGALPCSWPAPPTADSSAHVHGMRL